SLLLHLPRKLTSLITQMITGHIALNYHLHRIGKVESPFCGKCTHQILYGSYITVEHYVLRCPAYHQRRTPLEVRCAPRRQQLSLRRIFSNPENLAALATYINATGRLRQTLGVIPIWEPPSDEV
ncbi:hypothetical protein BDQ17DRAFT_1259690, partial [Cyathus striatus]